MFSYMASRRLLANPEEAAAANRLARIPLKEDFSISFGVYHKSLQGRPLLKSFLDAMENVLSE